MTVYIIVYSLILFFIAAAVITLSIIWVRTQRAKLNERAKQLATIESSEQLFAEIFGNAESASFIIVEANTYAPVYISQSSSAFFGVTAQKLRLDLTAIGDAVGKKSWRSFVNKYKEWDGSGVFSFDFNYGDGKRAIVQTARTTHEGKNYDAFLIYDITEQTEEMKELRESLDKALGEAAGKLTFLSSMSHEIRTPMNGVMGMMELARKNINNPKKAGEYLARAGDLSGFLLSIINDILDISKLESGKMLLYNTPFNIFAFADKIRNMFNGMVTGKGINFKVETIDFTTPYFMSDEMRLTQVVTNFISNANKFTPAGGSISVTFKQLDTIGGNAQILIRVRDTGKGIAPENIRKIMKPFEQEEASTAHNYGGTGLGLALCDQIVQLMGGNIVVDSELGKGTDFSVFLSLPFAEGAEEDADEAPQESEANGEFAYNGCRILLAEDNEVNAEIAMEILSDEGAVVTHAKDGQEAVDFYTNQPENSFDLILLDIHMPKLNGREAAKAIRASGKGDAKSVAIIALSADAFVEDIKLSKQAGMDGHVSKPVDFDELRITAGKVLSKKKAGR
ncbi:MAG: response regulator [Clostridiales bacterium]|nr:response regulator [Clostridiales bacterium]